MKALDEASIVAAITSLKEWQFVGGALEKKFVFRNFVEALGFIVQVGVVSEKRNHHPELINVYNKLTVRLSTHDVEGVTEKDVDLARAIDLL